MVTASLGSKPYNNDENFKKLFAKFMVPGSWVLVLGQGFMVHTVKMHYFYQNLIMKLSA